MFQPHTGKPSVASSTALGSLSQPVTSFSNALQGTQI